MKHIQESRRSGCGQFLRSLVLMTVVALLAGRAQAQVTNQTDVKTWRIWEGVFRTSQTYTNPSYDVKLKVTFTPPAGSNLSSIVSYGFWDGVESGQNVFRVRTSFPTAPGASPWVWTWTSSCTGGNCNTDSVLNQSTPLSVNVTPSTGLHALFSHGFLKVNNSGLNANRYLIHDDGTPFFWLGDTAWNASIRAKSALVGAPAEEWEQYVNDRRDKGFTVIQLALPVDYMDGTSGAQPQDAQSPTQKPFTPDTCTGPSPSCQWNPGYWKNFEQKVRYANGQGLVVLVVGLAERTVESSPTYPTIPNLQVHARNVVARLAGHFVIYSPGFDRCPDESTGSNLCQVQTQPSACTTSTNEMTCRIKFVGQEIKATSSRHLVVNHFAGKMDVSQMDPFQNESWLDFQVVQSGSGCQKNTEAEQTTELTKRARTMPFHFWDPLVTTVKPVVNVESIYDGSQCGPSSSITTTGNFTAYRARQTGYLSMLSGAVGYSFGVIGVFDWGNNTLGPNHTPIVWGPPTTAGTGTNRASNGQMQTLCKVFRSLPAWQQLVPDPNLIVNKVDPGTGQPWVDELQMVVARDVNNQFAVAYLPNNPAIKIETAGFTNFDSWTKEWIDPTTGAISAATCTRQGISTTYKCDRPGTTTPDWVLRLGASPFTATTLCG